jgi:phosphatidylethanolamine/phosphatidyl-N-methylethanolamine N-methyltransferase
LNIESVQKTYKRYAPQYDLLFGAVFHPGRKAVIRDLNCQSGEEILEVGVGTGLSLPLYDSSVNVTGIDISEEMLEVAIKRRQKLKLDNVELYAMNAQEMEFPDNHFDKVVAMYVASVVPDPVQLVNEMRRVCKPGGQLIFVNHFNSNNPVISRIEKWLEPLANTLGFHPGFSMEEFLHQTDLTIEQSIPVNLFGYWQLLRAINDKTDFSEEEVAAEVAIAI